MKDIWGLGFRWGHVNGIWSKEVYLDSTEDETIITPGYLDTTPIVNTISLTNITLTGVITGGIITSSKSDIISSVGVCWSTSSNPTISDNCNVDTYNSGSFISNVTGLTSGTTYYIRAYAINFFGTSYGDQIVFNTLDYRQKGEEFGGGIVFYTSDGGGHGLISMKTDLSDAIWGCSGTTVGASGTTIGTGYQNTQLIISGCSTVGIAALLCSGCTESGYTDWYLPSKDELSEMYNQKNIIGNFNEGNNEYYWTSTEHQSVTYQAWLIHFGSGSIILGDKSTSKHVRAIRSF